jgi:hypothetical protein
MGGYMVEFKKQKIMPAGRSVIEGADPCKLASCM